MIDGFSSCSPDYTYLPSAVLFIDITENIFLGSTGSPASFNILSLSVLVSFRLVAHDANGHMNTGVNTNPKHSNARTAK